MKMRFVAHYQDKKVIGNPLGNPDSGWSNLPDGITALEYTLPLGDSLILKNYEEFIHMVECIQPMGHQPMVEFVYLMGVRQGVVVSYRITILQKTKDDKFKLGDITVRLSPKGKEYRGGAVAGWKKGLL